MSNNMEEVFSLAREMMKKSDSSDDEFSPEENIELEFRFRSLNKERFERLYNFSKKNYEEIEEIYYTEDRAQLHGKSKSVHRKITKRGGIKTMDSKTQIKKIRLYDHWVSLVLSIEQKIYRSDIINSSLKKTRKKKRISFFLDERRARLDLTICKEDDTYQAEIEILDMEWIPVESIEEISKKILDSPLMIKRSMYECVDSIASNRYYIGEKYFCISERRYQTPKTLMIKQYHLLYYSDHFVTAKIDGQRRFLVIFNGRVFSVDSLCQIRKEDIIISYDKSSCCILDCEYKEGIYYVIDVVILEGRYIGNETSPIDRIHNFMIEYVENDKIRAKEYRLFGVRTYNDVLEWNKNLDIDGIVIVTNDYFGSCLKMKFKTTVDLFCDEDGDLMTSSGDVIGEDITVTGNPTPMKISEFVVKSSKRLELLRVREDKPNPNSTIVVFSNMSGEVGTMNLLEGRGSIMMRKMHNKVKRLMYKMVDVRGSIVLDIGSGQGGDISKWYGCKKVYSIEPNPEASLEMKSRMGRRKNLINQINARTSQYNKILQRINSKVDVITLFFCINLFEDDDLIGLYKIIRERSSNDCKIIGTYMEINKYESNICYTLENRGRKRYFIKLEGTRIEQEEREFDFDLFLEKLRSMGFILTLKSKLNHELSTLSNNEKKLTSMFWCFEFRNNKKFIYKWDRNKKENVTSLGRVVIDDMGRVLKIIDGEKYYFESNGEIGGVVNQEEIEMAKIRYSYR